jgi:hypothetical protein
VRGDVGSEQYSLWGESASKDLEVRIVDLGELGKEAVKLNLLALEM